MKATQETNNTPLVANSPKILVAVASKGRGLVNQHFGHAKEFQIYEVDATEATYVDTRFVTPYCQGGHSEKEALNEILRTLFDCKAVLVSRIGVGPDDRLREAGIEPVQTYEVIETALFDFYEQWIAETHQHPLQNA